MGLFRKRQTDKKAQSNGIENPVLPGVHYLRTFVMRLKKRWGKTQKSLQFSVRNGK
jgi:hypothetical protein